MADDLITTKAVAQRLGVSVATVNRWAIQNVLEPALTLPGDTGARLYRTADVDAYKATRETRATKAVEHGACPNCTSAGVQTWHDGPCPMAEAAS